MDEIEKIDEFAALPLKLAYPFLVEDGLEKEAIEIKESKDQYLSYTSTLKRGKIVALLEKNNLLDKFVDKCWSFGKTQEGRRKIQRYKRVYQAFRDSDRAEEEEEEESMEQTSFAMEEDLRDYLANNLSVIESGLQLFKDENDVEGIEYPIDADNRRVDILVLDKNNIPVIIELKVSRGYEKVIGQCLYYKNRVKQMLNSIKVRIIIIAREITPQLKTATEDLPDVELFQYKLSVNLERA